MAGYAVAALPRAAWSQRRHHLRVGWLSLQHRPEPVESGPNGEFLKAMYALGYSGANLSVEWRYAEFDDKRLPDLASELVKANVDIIVATTARAVRAAQRATGKIPIVIAVSGNPVAQKLVSSLSNPSENTTGVSSADPDRFPKQLEFLTKLVPKLTTVAYLTDRVTFEAVQKELRVPKSLREMAARLQISIQHFSAYSVEELEDAFASMKGQQVKGVIINSNPILNELRSPLASMALKNRMATAATRREYVKAGCLFSYGESQADFYYRAAKCVDKLAKGATPADLPIELPTRLRLDINQTTADALGITIPAQLQVLANEIVD